MIDQGFGMTETQIATAFEKYQTIQNPNSKSVDSFGLGLPIVKKLVSLQRGIIKLESKPKKETLVRLSFFYQNPNEIKNNSNPQQEQKDFLLDNLINELELYLSKTAESFNNLSKEKKSDFLSKIEQAKTNIHFFESLIVYNGNRHNPSNPKSFIYT